MNKSIEDIYKGYLKKELTPTEILNLYLDRINKFDKNLNSFTEIFETKVKKLLKDLIIYFVTKKIYLTHFSEFLSHLKIYSL